MEAKQNFSFLFLEGNIRCFLRYRSENDLFIRGNEIQYIMINLKK